jgi:hypothetical protein
MSMSKLFETKAKQDQGSRSKVEQPHTRYDFAPGESLERRYFSLWQVGVKPKQAKRGAVHTNIEGFMDMGRKGFLTGSALAAYRRRKVSME